MFERGSVPPEGPNEPGSPTAAYRFLRPCMLFAVTGIMMALIFGVLVPAGHLMYVWPVTGVQLALLLSSRQRGGRLHLEIAAASGATFVTGLVLHTALPICFLLAVVQALELELLLRVLRGHVRCFDDLKTRAHVARFISAALLIPSLIALLAPFSHLTHLSVLDLWIGVALSDSLGIAVSTPAVLFLLSGRLWRKDQAFQNFKAGSLTSLLFLGTAVAIFSQNTNPFLFMLFPPLILVVFVLGVRGAIFTALSATLIACWATSHGHGPIWITQNVTMEHRILVLQVFLWTIVATALPVGSLLDEQRASEQQARKNQRIYETLLQNSQDMIILSRLDGSSRFVSPAVARVIGWTQAEFAKLPPLEIVHEEDRDLARSILASLAQGKADHTTRYRALHKDGSYRWVEAYIRGYSDTDDGAINGYVATVHDISAHKRTEDSWSAEKHQLASQNEQLANLAGKDELTGIANRRTFNHYLTAEAARQGRASDPLSLLMIDVDSFKKFNDRYGHPAGDVCLRKVAQVFAECAARVSDVVARVGGEEFSIMLPQTGELGAVEVATHILESIRALRLVHEDSATGFVSVSIGIATWLPMEACESSKLIQQADRALYESKRAGRNRLTVWNVARQTTTRELANQPATV